MPNLIAVEPIRYSQSVLDVSIQGLLQTKAEKGIACTGIKSVNGFEIEHNSPNGTEIRICTSVDGTWYYIEQDGQLRAIMEQSVTAESVLAEGNSVNELLALTTIPAFLGKEVGLAIALRSQVAGVYPAIKIGIKGITAEPVTIRTETSPIYALSEETQIIKLDAKTTQENGGSVKVEARIANDGAQSDWAPISSYIGRKASSIQYRATLTAAQIGVSTAIIQSVTMQYRSGDNILSGVGVAELVSITRDWYVDIRDCRLTVRHAPLEHAKMTGYCAIRPKTKVSTGERIGLGTGERKTYQLAHVDGIAYDSVRIFADGNRILAGYEVNTQVGRVTFSAPEGAIITADYAYGWTQENWIQMPKTGTTKALNYDSTEFKVDVPNPEVDWSICAVKMALEMTEGQIVSEVIGAATGKMQTCALSCIAQEGRVRIFADGSELPSANWRLNDDGRSVVLVASVGTEISAQYDWISETPTVQQFVGVFR